MSQFSTQTIAKVPPYPVNQYGSAPAVSGLTYKIIENGPLRQVILTLSNVSVTMTDEAGVVAYGGIKVFDCPEGLIHHLGSVLDLDITKSGAGINADFDGDVGLGSVTASNNASLSSTEQNFVPTTATPQAVAGVTTANGVSTATEATIVLDGTATPVDVYLNFLIDDADQNGGGALLVSGTIYFNYLLCGDK